MSSTALATAFVNVVPSAKGFGSSLHGQLDGQLSQVGGSAGKSLGNSIGGTFKKVFAPIMAAVGTAAVGQFLKESVSAASNFQAEFEGVNQTFGKGAAAVQSYAKQASKLAGMTETEALRAAKSFGIYGKAAGLSSTANAEFSKTLLQAAGDLGSFYDLPTADALNAIQSGLRGEAEPLRRFGILLDDASLKAKAMEMGIIKTTKEALTPQQKILASNALILKQVGVAQGDFVKYSDTYGNAIKTASAEFANLKARIGESLLPAMAALARLASSVVIPALEKIRSVIVGFIDTLKSKGLQAGLDGITNSITGWIEGGGIQKMIQGFVELRAKIVTGLVEALPKIINSIVDALATALPSIVDGILSMVPTLLTTAQTLFTSLILALSNIVPKLITTLADMLPKIATTIASMLPGIITSAINLFMGLVQGLIVALPKLITALLDALPKILTALVTMLPAIINGAIQLFLGLVQGLVTMLPQLINTLTTVVLPKLISTIVALIPILIPAAVQLFLALVQGLAKAIPQIVAAVVKLVPVIVKALIGAIPLLIDAGFQLVKGLVKGIIDNGPKLIGGAIKGMADLAINSFKALLGIHSPSRVFIEFGKNIIKGLAIGLSGDAKSIEDQMQKVADWVTSAFADGKIYRKTAQLAQKVVAVYAAELAAVAVQHDEVMKKLNDAQDVLKAKIEERLNYIKSITEKFGSKLNQDESTTAASAIKQLKDRIARTKELAVTMGELAKMGLSGDLYQQILDSGNLEFAKSILAGGAATVQELSNLAAEANQTALDLGTQAGDILFNKGIEVAQGVVDGLKDKEAELSAIMSNIASSFSNAISNVISNDTRQADQAAADAAAKAQDKAQKAYDAAVKKYGKTSSQAKAAYTALANANKAETAAKATLNTNLKANIAQPTSVGTGELGQIGTVATQTTIVYNAAPNASISSEQALTTAIQRARLV